MALTDYMKLLLKISATDFDAEVDELIAAAKGELEYAGILKISEDDALIKRAIGLYVKANFGYDNPDRDKLIASFESLKNHLSLSSDYAFYTVTITAGSQCLISFDGTEQQTNISGIAVFYSRAKNHVLYVINGAEYYADITGDVTLPPEG